MWFWFIFYSYLKLILTTLISWPAVIFFLFLLIIFRHKEAINELLKRIKSVSRNGIEISPPDFEKERVPKKDREKNDANTGNVALVEYKIASSLPNTIFFDFINDWKVWFWIANSESKKYKAYVKIRFIVADGVDKEIDEGYYGGKTAWNLNAFSGIRAPGLKIPDEIKKTVMKKENIKIEINCTIKDENDNLVEKKLPNTYAYNFENKYWYLEP
jgi:hypothetical protein